LRRRSCCGVSYSCIRAKTGGDCESDKWVFQVFNKALKGLAAGVRRFNDTAFGLRETKLILDMTLWQQGHILLNQLLSESRNQEPLRLLRHGYRSFSQNDEDGIIEEILDRIGTDTKQFIEIGVENGQENNTHNLLYKGWRGTWIEVSATHVASINRDFADRIASDQLEILQRSVTLEFVDEMMKR
jgi:hypothetical protein